MRYEFKHRSFVMYMCDDFSYILPVFLPCLCVGSSVSENM